MNTGRVSPGDKIRGTFSANVHNTVLDMVRDYRSNRAPGADGQPNPALDITPATSVFAHRYGSEPVERFSPVVLEWTYSGLGALPEGTTTNPVEPTGYAARPVVRAVSPTTADVGKPVGITERTIPAGQFGRVFTTGLCIARVNVTNVSHRSAMLGTSARSLTSSEGGPVRILWPVPAEETGEQLCIVLLNGGGGGGVADGGFWAMITGKDDADEPDCLYSWRQVELIDDEWVQTTPEVTGTTNLKRAPSNGIPPVIPSGQVVRAWPSPTQADRYECPAHGGLQTLSIYTQENTWDTGTCVMTTRTYRYDITCRDGILPARTEV